jgi:NTP pyrophosphatase (non-canonical NTP hydrolase)
VARLLEELGELAESLAGSAVDDDGLASELADLWIITTAMADQFLGEVAEPDSDPGASRARADPLGELVAAAGWIARIVNYYDGPKTPRSLDGWPSLNDAVADFHRLLGAVAHAHGVDLGAAAADKLHAIPARDSDRFAQAEHDPSTAPCLEQFRLLETTVWGARVEQPRLWGAPAWSSQPLAANAAAIAPTLTSFTRAAQRERLDGYVIAGPALDSGQSPDEWARAVLGELAGHDPRGAEAAPAGGGGGSSSSSAMPQSAFAFAGARLSVTALGGQPHIVLRVDDGERVDEPR